MSPERSDLHHQLVALLKQPHLTLHCEREPHAHFVMRVAFLERKRGFSARHGRRVVLILIEHVGQFLQPLTPQYFVSEQRNALHRHGREIFFDLVQDFGLGSAPLIEPGIGYRVRQNAIHDDVIDGQTVQ